MTGILGWVLLISIIPVEEVATLQMGLLRITRAINIQEQEMDMPAFLFFLNYINEYLGVKLKQTLKKRELYFIPYFVVASNESILFRWIPGSF
jgi:hypothetical protein